MLVLESNVDPEQQSRKESQPLFHQSLNKIIKHPHQYQFQRRVVLGLGFILYLLVLLKLFFSQVKPQTQYFLFDHYIKKQVNQIAEFNHLDQCLFAKKLKIKGLKSQCISQKILKKWEQKQKQSNFQSQYKQFDWVQCFDINLNLSDQELVAYLGILSKTANNGIIIGIKQKLDSQLETIDQKITRQLLQNNFTRNQFLIKSYNEKIDEVNTKFLFFEKIFLIQVDKNGFYLEKDSLLRNKLIFRPELFQILKSHYQTRKVKSIIDFGGGLCTLAEKLAQKGYFVQCYDGNPSTPEITKFGKVLDLTEPQNLGMQFDWVQSFDVGEHLPPESTNQFIETLTKHAKYGIILSWAIPGQGNFHHQNAKPNQQVIKLIKQKGFKYDIKLSQSYRKIGDDWSKTSLMVFQRIR